MNSRVVCADFNLIFWAYRVSDPITKKSINKMPKT